MVLLGELDKAGWGSDDWGVGLGGMGGGGPGVAIVLERDGTGDGLGGSTGPAGGVALCSMNAAASSAGNDSTEVPPANGDAAPFDEVSLLSEAPDALSMLDCLTGLLIDALGGSSEPRRSVLLPVDALAEASGAGVTGCLESWRDGGGGGARFFSGTLVGIDTSINCCDDATSGGGVLAGSSSALVTLSSGAVLLSCAWEAFSPT